MPSNKRIFYVLPNVFTALNMACGFVSCILSFRGDFYKASIILLFASLFDSFDGKVARLTGTESSFGEQFDSMSDIISFGVAPALLLYQCYLKGYGRFGIVVPFIFLLCAALRLARFNSNIEKVDSKFFQGLPSPAGALAVAGLVLFSVEFDILKSSLVLPSFVSVLISVLMISNVPFNSFKNSDWVKGHKKLLFIIIILTMALTISFLEIMVGGIIFTYIISSLVYFLLKRGELKDVFKWTDH